MGTLYFDRSNGERITIAENISKQDVYKCITKAVKDMNPSYKIYYMREWETADGTRYDVGSHTEFFQFVE